MRGSLRARLSSQDLGHLVRRTSGLLRVLLARRADSGEETVEEAFWSHDYQRHNQRRQEHLASLHLPLVGKSVLEVGAGVGDHTSFFIDRGCDVTTSDGRPGNVEQLNLRFPDMDVRLLDLDPPRADPIEVQVIYCYGLLYHLSDPEAAIDYLARCTTELLLLETCVSFGDEEAANSVEEPQHSLSQAVTGVGCRPTRPWIWARLAERFEHVYATRTQPWHEQFPLDWQTPPRDGRLTRSVFVASRQPLSCEPLLDHLPSNQFRH